MDTLFGDECVCDGRCKECFIRQTSKHCKLCSGYYGLDFKNLGIDNFNSENGPQYPSRTCVCPANYHHINATNKVISEVVFAKIECGYYPVDDRFCIGINPQIFFIGINFADYWIIIGSILSIILILCCAVYSVLKNNCCLNSEQLLTMYEQSFPLSTLRHSRIESSSYVTDNQLMSDSSLPPTYDEVFNISSNSSRIKPLVNETIFDGNDRLPTYEDALRIV